jgi:uncharacterized protein (DUF1330 family)
MSVHPEPAQLDAMATGSPDEPVVMLNLLRYRDVAADGYGVDGFTGEEAYRRYGQAFAALGPRFGGEPIWMGRAGHTLIGPTDESWDVAILVRYPTRRSFLDMLADPEYQAIAPVRAAALADSRLVELEQLLPR